MRVLWIATKAPWPPRAGGRLLLAETLARMRELRVARYFPQPPSVSAGGTATQLVEIEVIDQATQTVSTINQVLEWRWDMEDKRWWLMTPPPDLGVRD